MRTDQQISDDVIEGIKWARDIEPTEIEVTVKYGVESLLGTVSPYAEKLDWEPK